jgi:riboflavin kinase/FMN adenylyltransferase
VSLWRQLSAVDVEGPTVATIGNFDGVHRGHQVVLDRAEQAAWRLGGRHRPPSEGRAAVIAVTFDPHPMQVLAPDRAPVTLTALEHRAELLHGVGADHVLAMPFDRGVAGWSPEQFVQQVLVDTLHVGAVVVGADFRFGARAAGTVDTLRTLGAAFGFEVDAVELVAGVGDAPWSSTVIRAAIAHGDVRSAARALGRDHSVRGVVVEGDKRGRALGYPTANVPAFGLVAVPADGVYAGTLRRLDQVGSPALPAAVSVGTNPTFAGVDRRVEAYVLDRDDLELYGVPVEVTFHAHLRGQATYDDVSALVRQMARDVEDARTALRHS